MMKNFNIRFFPVRPDNVMRGKEKAEKISASIKSLHSDPSGPYSEWKEGRPHMRRENLGNNIKDIEKHRTAVKKGMAKYMETEQYKLGKIENGKKHMIPCYHYDVKYDSLKDAAREAGVTTGCLRNWIKNNKNGWRR